MTGSSPGGWRWLCLPCALGAIGAFMGARRYHEPTGYFFSALLAVAAVWFLLRKNDT